MRRRRIVKLRWTSLSSVLVLAVAMAGEGMTPAAGQGIESHWAGKNVTISVGYKAGGGADTMARLLAVHLSNHIPGKPKIIVENRPGGGTATNARDMLRRPADGTYIGQFAQTLMVADALGKAPEWFKWARYGYLGMVDGASEDSLYVVCGRTSAMKNLDDFLAGKDWRWGEISPRTGAGKDLTWFSLTKFPIRAFFGYGGSAEVAAGFDRGEMDVTSRCTEQEALRYPQWFEQNKIVPLFGWGEMNPDKHVPPDNPISNGIREGRWPWFGDARKTLRHLATDDQWAAFNAMYAMTGTHVWALPPGVPSNVTKALQESFWKTINSPEFRADMLKRNRAVLPLSAADLRSRIQSVQSLPPGALAVLNKVFSSR